MCGSKCVCVCKGWSVSVCVSGCSCVHSNEVCRWYSGINTAALVMPLHYPPYLPLTPLLTPSVHLFLYLHIRLFLSPPLPHCYYPSFTVAYITLYLPSYITPHSTFLISLPLPLSPPRPLYPTAVDIAASLEDGPGSHTVLPASPSQVHGQGAPPQSSASQVLFGSDLSQLDKDLIFDGLKKLYKKKVRIGSSFPCSFLCSCLGGSGTDGVAFEWSRRELNTISTDVML